MNYKKLLGNYEKMPIMVNNKLFNLMKNDSKIPTEEMLGYDLTTLLNVLPEKSNPSLIMIMVTKEGLKYDFSRLKEEMFEYFDIKDRKNAITELEKLQEDLFLKRLNLFNLSDLMYERYKKDLYEVLSNFNKKTARLSQNKRKGRNKLLRSIEEFEIESTLNRISDEAEAFKNFLINEKNYKVSDVFNEDKLNLYLAYNIVYKHSKLCRENIKDEEYLKKYNESLKYLREYVEREKSNFLGSDVNKSGNKEYLEIKNYLEMIDKEKEKKIRQKETEKKNSNFYNYTFFESDGETSKEVLNNAYNYCYKKENSSDLKLLLKRKEDFYNSLNYKDILIGRDTFNGYIGFRLENDVVILDKLFEDMRKGIIATDNAIYIANNNEEFEKISRLSKTKAIKAINEGKINAKRVIHHNSFEQEVTDYINKIEEIKKIKKL